MIEDFEKHNEEICKIIIDYINKNNIHVCDINITPDKTNITYNIVTDNGFNTLKIETSNDKLNV